MIDASLADAPAPRVQICCGMEQHAGGRSKIDILKFHVDAGAADPEDRALDIFHGEITHAAHNGVFAVAVHDIHVDAVAAIQGVGAPIGGIDPGIIAPGVS
jgi:hypothetical protein